MNSNPPLLYQNISKPTKFMTRQNLFLSKNIWKQSSISKFSHNSLLEKILFWNNYTKKFNDIFLFCIQGIWMMTRFLQISKFNNRKNSIFNHVKSSNKITLKILNNFKTYLKTLKNLELTLESFMRISKDVFKLKLIRNKID